MHRLHELIVKRAHCRKSINVVDNLASGFLNKHIAIAYWVTGLRVAETESCIPNGQGAKNKENQHIYSISR